MLQIPFKAKSNDKKVRLLFEKDKPGSLVFLSKNTIEAEEAAFAQEIKHTKGTRSLEIGDRIRVIAEKVAPHNGGDPNAVGRALTDYRDNRFNDDRPDDADESWSPYPKFDAYSGYFAMHAQKELDDFTAYLSDTADRWDQAAIATIIMRRAEKNKELGFDPQKWKLEDSMKLEEFFLLQLSNFYWTEFRHLTEYHLEPFEETEEFIFEYHQSNFLKILDKGKDSTNKEKTETEEEQQKKEALVGKS